MHITTVLVYHRDDSEDSLSLAQVGQQIEAHLASLPVLQRKLHDPMMGMDEPYWVDDNHFDIDQHLYDTALPTPGDWPQFRAKIAAIHQQRLNLRIPPWEAHIIRGLDSIDELPTGCAALLLKIHHAAIDGISLAKLIYTLHQAVDTGLKSIEPEKGETDLPDTLSMLSQVNIKSVDRTKKLTDTATRLLPALKNMQASRRGPDPSNKNMSRLKTRFNKRVDRERCTGAVYMDMVQFKKIKRSIKGVTPNDIAVSIVGGALRHYLKAHKELPRKTLACGAPVNLRNAQAGKTNSREEKISGNQIATMRMGLGTQIEDPIERVRAVHQYALEGKENINILGSGIVMDISDSLMPQFLHEGLRAISLATQHTSLPVPYHVMVSNVPGSPRPTYLPGAELQLVLGFGPLRDTMGLFHIVTHNAQRYSISFTSCPTMLPDEDVYEECLRRSIRELLAKIE